MRRLAAAILLGMALVLTPFPASTGAAPPFPVLTAIRAAHHPGFDRIVFEFAGGLPGRTTARWVSRVTHDASGRPAAVQGNAFIAVVLRGATAHEDTPGFPSTYGPRRRAYDLPNIAHLVATGDFEAVVSFGVGVMKHTRIVRRARLTHPARFVVDVSTSFRQMRLPVMFLERDAVMGETPPSLEPVARTVPRDARATSALLRLWAGPTQAEKAAGFRFRSSGTTGFRDLGINARGIARLTLRGPCDGGGETLTVADEVIGTLKPLASIRWVKILDPSGSTLHPWGERDSIPACLAPVPG
jgi:hypothetical protein